MQILSVYREKKDSLVVYRTETLSPEYEILFLYGLSLPFKILIPPGYVCT